MEKTRGYQKDFHASFERVRDRELRLRRANKIKLVLQQYIPEDISQAICLDVGCSAGVMTATLASNFATTIGIDYDRTAFPAIQPDDKAQADFTRGDALCLPFADRQIDFIICAQVYEHVPNDVLMFNEIFRVLKPGGICFFSGPNWLFPIEPHFFLPFLHWLPEVWADRYLRFSGQGDHYYERSRTLWSLQSLLHPFDIQDITLNILHDFYLPRQQGLSAKLFNSVPFIVWQALLPVMPNFNWILRKPTS